MCGTDLFLAVLAIFFPPIGVWVKRGLCSADSLINLALCCLGYFPGLLHAWYIIYVYPDPYDAVAQDSESQPPPGGATVTYYYVQQGRSDGSRQYRQPATYGGSGGGYGTVGPSPAGGQFPGQQGGTVNSFAQQGRESSARPQEEGLPSYQDAVQGDHKIQTRD